MVRKVTENAAKFQGNDDTPGFFQSILYVEDIYCQAKLCFLMLNDTDSAAIVS